MQSKSDILKLIRYLTYQTENYAIGMHFYGRTDVDANIDSFVRLTGKKPAYIDYDMHSLPFRPQEEIDGAVAALTEWAKGDGFIALSDHWLTPNANYKDEVERGANNCRFRLTKEEFYNIMTEGTLQHKNFLDELKIKGTFLKKLQENGVNVIYRPLHEANGEWFWWGVHPTDGIHGEDVAELYRFVHRYYTTEWGLDNIIWQYCSALCGSKEDLYSWYPGAEYVDMVATDWYISMDENTDPTSGGGYKMVYDKGVEVCGEVPFAIAEYGGDGTYPASSYSLKRTLSTVEAQMDRGAKLGFLGLYFDISAQQDTTLPARAITLEQMADYRKRSAE